MLWLQVTQLSEAHRIIGCAMALHTFEFFILYQCICWIQWLDNGNLVPRASLLPFRRESLRTRLCEHGYRIEN